MFQILSGNLRAIDTDFTKVSLLLHFDGSNGSTTFTDSGPNVFSMTAVGNSQISTTQSKFSGTSGYFDGNGDSLTAPANAAFAFGSGDFTIEGWLYSLDTGSSLRGIFDTRASQFSQPALMFRENSGGFLIFTNATTLISTTTGRTPNQWQHFALVRYNGVITLYLNGVANASANDSTNFTDTNCRISGFVDTQVSPYAYNGYIDEFRVTKVAKYQSNFSVPTAPYPSLPVAGAVLWLDSSQQNSIFTDAGTTVVANNGDLIYQWNDLSGNNRNSAQTTSGNRPTYVSSANGQNGLGGTTYNGTTQFLTVASTIGWNLVYSGDFTIDVVHKASSAGGVLIGQSNGPGITPKWSFGYGAQGVVGAGNYGFHFNGGGFNGFVSVAWSPTNGQTYRLTAVRSGNDHVFYVNGVQQGSVQTTTNRPGNPTQNATVGQLGNGDGSYINNPIYEISAYAFAMSASQLRQLSAYSLSKWQVS